MEIFDVCHYDAPWMGKAGAMLQNCSGMKVLIGLIAFYLHHLPVGHWWYDPKVTPKNKTSALGAFGSSATSCSTSHVRRSQMYS